MSTSDLSEVKDATVEDDTSENRYSTTPGHGIVKISPQNGSEEREGTYEDLNPTPDKGSFKKGGHDNEASSDSMRAFYDRKMVFGICIAALLLSTAGLFLGIINLTMNLLQDKQNHISCTCLNDTPDSAANAHLSFRVNESFDSINTQLAMYYADIANLNASVNTINTQLTSTSSALTTLTSSVNVSIDSINTQLTVTSATLANLSSTLITSVDSVNTKLNATSSAFTSLSLSVNASIDSVNSQLATTSSALARVNTSIISINTKLDTTSADFVNLSTRVNSITAQFASTSSAVNNLNSTVNTQLATISYDVATLNTKVNTITKHLTEISSSSTTKLNVPQLLCILLYVINTAI